MVLGSGNLGLVYFTDGDRLSLEALHRPVSALLPGLVAHPGVSFVAVLSEADGAVVIGAEGTRRLRDGFVEGVDPLRPFGEYAAPLVATAVEMAEAPDVYVNSVYDPATEEIAAFEGLVGAHGGAGRTAACCSHRSNCCPTHPTSSGPIIYTNTWWGCSSVSVTAAVCTRSMTAEASARPRRPPDVPRP